jgi:hypothetical protein
MIYALSLIGFFLMWGIFGSVAAAPRADPAKQATLPALENTALAPDATDPEGIPITGEPELLWTEILGFYGLIAVAALFLILALLNFANRSTAPYIEPGHPSSSEETHRD